MQVIKLSKLSPAGVVYRGVCYGKLDSKFWSPNADGVCGGVTLTFILNRIPICHL